MRKLLLLIILMLTLTARANEKVYLHLDQTAYFLGEKIWFCAYVNDTRTNAPTTLSRVLYVELVAPEGEVVERRVCKIEQGRASGCIELRESLLSGLFEIRAYTRYMMNWRYGENYYWRVIPIFNAVTEGHYEVRNILKRDYFKAKKSKRERKMREASERETSERISQLKVAADNIKPLTLTVDSVPTDLQPNQTVRLCFHGEPNTTFSLSIADAESHIPTNHNGNITSDLTRNHHWAFSEHLSNRYPAPDYVARPEQGITLRGKIITKDQLAEEKAQVKGVPSWPFTVEADIDGETILTTDTTDSTGMFQIQFGDMSGTNHVLLYCPSTQKDARAFLLDKWFSPWHRAYTEEEKHLLDIPHQEPQKDIDTLSSMDKNLPELDVKGKKRYRTWTELKRSALRINLLEELEWQMDNYSEMAWGYLKQKDACGLTFGVWGASFGVYVKDHYLFPELPMRQVMLDGPYLGDTVVPTHKAITDWYIPASELLSYKEVVVRTDWPICEEYNYGRYPPRISNQKTPNETTLTTTGMFNFKNEKYPSIVICYVPYAEGEQRHINIIPHNRHTFVHGYSVFPKFNEKQPYRRTLYWNPSVTTDANGDATVEFQNNATCREIVISAEGIMADGRPVLFGL